jgi:membrane carboxypeptidase/penicillin-binding protein
MRVRAEAVVSRIGRSWLARLGWKNGLVRFFVCTSAFAAVLASAGFYHIYFDRNSLPDLDQFTRFEFPTIGHIYDANGQPLKEMASESRQISRYEEIPPVVRDALLAAEDKNFFSHSGVDYSGFARVLCKIRLGDLVGRLARIGSRDAANNSAIFPQGGSTITQQLVRGYFLKTMTAQENTDQLRPGNRMAHLLSKRDRSANGQHAGSESGRNPSLVVG